jgi:hypothetical protein
LKNRKRSRNLLEPHLDLYNQLDDSRIGKLVDISDMGIRMISDEAVPDNTFFRMAIKLPMKINDSEVLFFDAISLWCKQDHETESHSIGCQVLNIKPEELQKLADLIETYSQSE